MLEELLERLSSELCIRVFYVLILTGLLFFHGRGWRMTNFLTSDAFGTSMSLCNFTGVSTLAIQSSCAFAIINLSLVHLILGTAGAPSRRKRFCMRFVDPIPGPPWNSIDTPRQRADAFWCWKILLLPLAPNINVAKTCNLTRHLTFQAICPQGTSRKPSKTTKTKTTTE